MELEKKHPRTVTFQPNQRNMKRVNKLRLKKGLLTRVMNNALDFYYLNHKPA